MLLKDLRHQAWNVSLVFALPLAAGVVRLTGLRWGDYRSADVAETLLMLNAMLAFPLTVALTGFNLVGQENWSLVGTLPMSRVRVLGQKLGAAALLTAGALGAAAAGAALVQPIPMTGWQWALVASLGLTAACVGMLAGLATGSMAAGVIWLALSALAAVALAAPLGLWNSLVDCLKIYLSLAPLPLAVLAVLLAVGAVAAQFALRRPHRTIRNALSAAAFLVALVIGTLGAAAGFAAGAFTAPARSEAAFLLDVQHLGGGRLLIDGFWRRPAWLYRLGDRLGFPAEHGLKRTVLAEPGRDELIPLGGLERWETITASDDGRFIAMLGYPEPSARTPGVRFGVFDAAGREVFRRILQVQELGWASTHRLFWRPGSTELYLVQAGYLRRFDLPGGGEGVLPLASAPAAPAGAPAIDWQDFGFLDADTLFWARRFESAALDGLVWSPGARRWESAFRLSGVTAEPAAPWAKSVESVSVGGFFPRCGIPFAGATLFAARSGGEIRTIQVDDPGAAAVFTDAGVLVEAAGQLELRRWADGQAAFRVPFPHALSGGAAFGDRALLVGRPRGGDTPADRLLLIDLADGRLTLLGDPLPAGQVYWLQGQRGAMAQVRLTVRPNPTLLLVDIAAGRFVGSFDPMSLNRR
jgi:catechol 2,3-dioxygenase-like lactoylglutathione lyase family enzyme